MRRTGRLTMVLVVAGTLGACAGGSDDVSTPAATDGADVSAESGDAGTSTPTTAGTAPAPADSPTDPPAGSPSSPSTTAAPVTTLPRPTESVVIVGDDGTVTESDLAPPGPMGYDELVDAGIEAGIWDELTGVTTVLGWVLGVVPDDQVPGADEVVVADVGDVLRRANAFALSGEYTDDELATLRSYYEVFTPPVDALDAAASRAARAGFARPRQASGDCTTIDPLDFDPDVVFVDCYDVLTAEAAGASLRVFVPRIYDDDPETFNLGVTAIAALQHSVEVYQQYGEVGDIDLVLTAVQRSGPTSVAADATVTARWGTLTVAGCPISIFGNAMGAGPEAFEQIIAHEAWHCTQHYDGFPMSVVAGTKWYREGGAEFFSNVAYPANDFENRVANAFDRRSLDKPLQDLSYDAWIWWQYVSNNSDPGRVADLHRSMMAAGGSGIDQIADLDETFHNFVVEYVAGTLKDQDGTDLPSAHHFTSDVDPVAKDDAGRVIDLKGKQYVARRFSLGYEKQLRVLESDATATPGRFSSAEWAQRGSLASWAGLAQEVRSTCTEPARYAFVATSFSGDPIYKVKIDEVEEAACDPCVLGTWSLQLDTFRSMLVNAMAAQGQPLPPGMDWRFGGAYYVQFVDEETLREQRDHLEITTSMSGGAFTVTIDSFATGTYRADGERLEVFDLDESYARVTTDFGVGIDAPSALDQGAGSYVCDADTLTVSVDGFDPVVWDRVDKILEPNDGDATTTGDPGGGG